ncbi:NAD(P)H-hydrate dehydratase [Thalassobacillus hwangdonensis]|uniref:Bifunctional NAD(P)H-hydrate repair enzyme n=1 Tax=Thalassobacillus hwangdonensis TaxID=546108 RepID=A0ABW3L2J2_9BACI
MNIVTAKEMYVWDRQAMEEAGIDGKILMENAGRAVAQNVEKLVDKRQRILVLIGAGNNGGDGFVIARTLLNKGYTVRAVQVVPDEKIKGDALAHKHMFLASNYQLEHLEKLLDLFQSIDHSDVVIDSMLGIGVEGRLRSPIDQVVEYLNQSKCLKIAVDIPSGVPADEGVTDFSGLKVDHTFTIAAPKISMFIEKTAPYFGEWEVVEIGLPTAKLKKAKRKLWEKRDVAATFPRRNAYAHKGVHGKALFVGGSFSMPGSIAMAARAGLRSGAGLATVATVESAWPSVAAHIPEATYTRVEEEAGSMVGVIDSGIEGYDAIAIGMGMGRKEGAEAMLRNVLEKSTCPVLIDADGLYHAKQLLDEVSVRNAPVILTPHPGEMAHLLGIKVPELLARPFEWSQRLASERGVYVVLKGPATIITTPEGTQYVETSGNAGLAKGGSGDVLSGILLAMIMQTSSVADALCNGCFLHGKTAERLTEDSHSQVDLLATDVVEGLSQTLRTFSG